jgi:thioredoxin 1
MAQFTHRHGRVQSRRETKMSDKVVHVGDADFDSAVLNSKEPVLVDFWAEWCGPCKMIAPALDELADAYQGRAKIAKVNVDHNRALAAKYHAFDSVPGRVQGRREGRRADRCGGQGPAGRPAGQGPGLILLFPAAAACGCRRAPPSMMNAVPGDLHAPRAGDSVGIRPRSRAAPSGRSFFQTHSQRSPPQPGARTFSEE